MTPVGSGSAPRSGEEMSYATVLAQIKSVLEGVSGIANVQDYLRWGATEAEVDAHIVSGGPTPSVKTPTDMPPRIGGWQ